MNRPDSHLPLGNLVFHILLALGDGPAHGYAIIRDVEERSGGHVTVRSGSLYAAIQRLTESGLVAPADAPPGEDARRKYHRITDLGRRVAAAEAGRLAGLISLARARNLAPES